LAPIESKQCRDITKEAFLDNLPFIRLQLRGFDFQVAMLRMHLPLDPTGALVPWDIRVGYILMYVLSVPKFGSASE
jgi:hypothetical protein